MRAQPHLRKVARGFIRPWAGEATVHPVRNLSEERVASLVEWRRAHHFHAVHTCLNKPRAQRIEGRQGACERFLHAAISPGTWVRPGDGCEARIALLRSGDALHKLGAVRSLWSEWEGCCR